MIYCRCSLVSFLPMHFESSHHSPWSDGWNICRESETDPSMSSRGFPCPTWSSRFVRMITSATHLMTIVDWITLWNVSLLPLHSSVVCLLVFHHQSQMNLTEPVNRAIQSVVAVLLKQNMLIPELEQYLNTSKGVHSWSSIFFSLTKLLTNSSTFASLSNCHDNA